ncbi:MAG: FAD-dependent oxidoreductase [Proteobacteria bacterium]|nr:FAD-dependent oxidoreductase [Pseudomonadota bacterium]
MYSNLFRPITINKIEIKNRIAYPSLALIYSEDSQLNDRYYGYYRERARGGAGIVTVGPVGVDTLGGGPIALSLMCDAVIPAFAKAAKGIKEEGARAWIQLFHAGAYTYPAFIEGKEPIAPSAIYSPYSKTTPREMTIVDIENVQQAFSRAALRAKEAGFDGVEIIGSAGYLITQFLSPLRNKRTDAYGGSLENRMRFPCELITLLRKRLGQDYPLTIRMAGHDFVDGSNTDMEMGEIARRYEKNGVDAINVTGGWHESKVPQLPMELPRAGFGFLARNIKAAVTVPVMASNRIADPATADRLIGEGTADLVVLGRGLIADPMWPQKAQEGRADEIRPCVACSQGCTDQIFNGQPVFCIANPLAGFETERKLVKTESPKTVMVVGAGVAGLEAAVTLTERGHQVTVYEQQGEIGGQIHLASAPPYKQELMEFVRYYRAKIKRHRITLRLRTKVDGALIKKVGPDHVIIAEGAEPEAPPIQGVGDPEVVSAWDVLTGKARLGENVAVVGGGLVGLETALYVASRGTITPDVLYFLVANDAVPPERLKELMFRGMSRVTVFEMLPKVGQDVGKSTKWILLGNVKKFGVKVVAGAVVTSVCNGTVIYGKEGETGEGKFDTVVLASGVKSRAILSKEMETLGIPFTVIGDAVKPGKIDHAIHGGFLAALDV